MNTPTHILLSAALLAKPDNRVRNWAVIIGSLVPDLSLYVMWANAKFIQGLSDRVIFRDLHFSDFWQMLNAISNSIPLYAGILLVGLWRKSLLLIMLGAAALLHMAGDFPLHNSDAHRHFWPISDWRFHSPISYWNPRYHGDIVGMIEIGLALVLIAILWRRFKSWKVRACLFLALIPYIGVPLYFSAL
ncbi:MAG: hypothetical protein JKY32_04970 [Rhizobiales bacterium]|nr:hypothetical protein [Hyphomicrobiales bacterium]